MSKARELIDALAAEGELESEGSFTLDREKAREKLQKFQLAEPERYVVLLAEAALMAGASEIEFRVDGDDVRVRYDGDAISRDDLDALWDSILTDTGDRPGLRQLALALNAAMGLSPKYLRVESGNDAGRYRLELRPDRSTSIENRKPDDAHNFVHVRERLHMGSIADAIAARQGDRREQLLLREHCAYIESAVLLNGKRISKGFPEQIGGSTVHFEGDGYRGAVGLGPLGSFASEFTFCSHGLKIVSRRFDDLPGGLVGVVNSVRLQRDVSQADVRRDAHLEKLEALVRAAAWRCIATAAPTIVDPEADASGTLEWKQPERKGLIYAALEKAGPALFEGEHPLAPVLVLPLWRTVGGEARTTAQLLELRERDEPIPFIKTSFEDYVPPGEEHVLMVDQVTHLTTLEALFGDALESRHGRFAKALKAHKNEMRWRATRLDPVLPPGNWSLRQPFESGRVRGEVGLRERPGRIDILVEGGHLCSFEHGLPVEGVHIVLEGPFSPRKNFDGVHRNEQLVKALIHVAGVLADMFAQYESPFGEHPSVRAARIDAMLPFFMGQPFGLELLLGAGFKLATAKRHLKRHKSEQSRPQLDPRQDDAHGLTRVPFILGMHTYEHLSLVDVAQIASDEGAIYHFDTDYQTPAPEEGAPKAVIVNEEQFELLTTIWEATDFESGTAVYQRWRARQRHMKQTPQARAEVMAEVTPNLYYAGTRELEGMTLEFVLDAREITNWSSHVMVDGLLEVRFLDRHVLQRRLSSGLHGLQIIANVSEELLTDRYDDLIEPAFAQLHTARALFFDRLDFEQVAGWGLPAYTLHALCKVVVWSCRERKDYDELLAGRLLPFTQRIELETVQGTKISLAELIDRANEISCLEYLVRIDLADMADRPLIGPDRQQFHFAAAVVPHPSRDVSEDLASAKRAKALREREAVDELALIRGALVQVDLDLPLEGGRVRAELGLPCIDPWQGVGQMNCYLDMRLVETMPTPLKLAVDAAIDAPWQLERVNEVRRDEVYERCRSLLRASYERMLRQLLGDWKPKQGGVTALRARWVVALAGGIGLKHLDEDLLEAVRTRTFLGRHEMKPTNIAAIQKASRSGKRVAWVDAGRAALLHPPGGTLLLDATIAEELARTFELDLRDATEALYERRQARLSRPAIEERLPRPWPPVGSFVSSEVEAKKVGWKATLWIDADTRPLKVVCDGTFVCELPLWDGLRVSGIVRVAPHLVRDDWEQVALGEATDSIRRRGYLLVRQLADAIDDEPETSAAARHRLADMFAKLEGSDFKLTGAPRKAHARLYRTPIHRDTEVRGAWISPQGLDQRKQERETAQADELARKQAAIAERDARRRELVAKAKRMGSEVLDAVVGERSLEMLDALELEPVETIEVHDPRTSFLESLRTTLDRAARAANWPMKDAQIDHVDYERAAPKFAYTLDDGPKLNPEHPLVAHAIETGEDDPATTTILASAAATGINLWLEEITVRHEMALLVGLMRQLNPKS